MEKKKIDEYAVGGYTLGLISILSWLLPLVGYPVTICGIVFSSKGLASKTNAKKAKTGLILSIIFLVLTITNSIMGVILYYK